MVADNILKRLGSNVIGKRNGERALVGLEVGLAVVAAVGRVLGARVCPCLVGERVGAAVGLVGDTEGLEDGASVGVFVGAATGFFVVGA